MKKLLYVAVIVVFFLLALSFYLNNPQVVTLSYYMGFEKEMPLSLLLWITLFIGVVIGWLAGVVRNLRLRRRLAQANRTLRIVDT